MIRSERRRPAGRHGGGSPPPSFTRPRRDLCLFLLLLVFAFPALAAIEVKVVAPPSLERAAAEIRAVEPERLARVARMTGFVQPLTIEAVLLDEASPVAAQVPRWIAGFAVTERNLVVLFPERVPKYPNQRLEELLRHEIAHVLIDRAAGGGEVPRWFHEGVSMIAGDPWDFNDRRTFAVELLGGRISVARLDAMFVGSEASAQKAYAFSGAFANRLLQRHGADVFSRILAGIGRGQTFAFAFREVTGESIADAEEEFWRRYTFWFRWVPFLTSSGVLWGVVTLLALWAIVRRRRRTAEVLRRWEEEERPFEEEVEDEPQDEEPVN